MYFLGAKPPYLRIGLLLLWCATLIAYWISRTFDYLATFLLWNLFLATLPLVGVCFAP